MSTTTGAPTPRAASEPSRPFYPKVKFVDINFKTHPMYPEHDYAALMSEAYGFCFKLDELLLPDGSNFDDPDSVIDVMKDKILKKIMSKANQGTATQTTIEELIEDCFTITGTVGARGTTIDLDDIIPMQRVIVSANKQRGTDVAADLEIDWTKVFIDTSKPLNVYDLSMFSKDPFPVALPTTPTTPAANIPATPAPLNAPAPPTPGNSQNDRIIAMMAVQNQISQQNQVMMNNMQTSNAAANYHKSINPFIPMNFPQKVCDRYRLNMSQYKYHTQHDLTYLEDTTRNPPVDRKYHPDPSALATGFVTVDGTYFVLIDLGPQSEKNFRNNVNKFTGSSTYEFFNWYTAFTSHCARFGKYCHPYPCFQPKCPHPRGFTLGANRDDDLSASFETKIVMDTRIIWDVIYSVFNKHDNYRHIIELNDGKGYEALRSILAYSHPALIQQPADLVTTRPTQKELTLLEYWKKYNHYIMLRAYIESNECTLHDNYERIHFVKGCKYSSYLQTEIRREQEFPSLQYKFKPSNFVTTLQQYLDLPNSPVSIQNPMSQRSSLRHRNNLNRDNFVGRTTPFNSNSGKSFSNQTQFRPERQPLTESSNNPKRTINALTQHENHDFNDQILTDPHHQPMDEYDDDSLMYAYSCQIHQINAQPKSFDRNCLVCEMMTGETSSHKFEDCPILANSNLLRQQFINFCQVYKRGRRALSSPPTGKQNINQLTVDTNLNPEQNINDAIMKEEDFV